MTGKEGEDIEGFASESCEVMRAAILVQQKQFKKERKKLQTTAFSVYIEVSMILFTSKQRRILHVRMYMILFINEFLNQKTQLRLKLKGAKYMMIKTQQFTQKISLMVVLLIGRQLCVKCDLFTNILLRVIGFKTNFTTFMIQFAFSLLDPINALDFCQKTQPLKVH